MAVSRKPDPPVPLFNLPPSRQSLPVIQPGQGHDCVVALRALGEDTRVRIVGLLLDQPMEVNEIAKRLGVSQYNVSKHLRILREAGLLEVEKDGRRHLYALPDAMRPAAASGVLDLGCCSFQFEGKPVRRSRSRKR
jgi:DNA-binding transcriptional ArsR family regulator